ncbi:MAG: hypothetical protein ACXVY5_05880 [Gaiellales bacterium]
MQSPAPDPSPPVVDERWFRDWVAFDMLEIAVYLTRHAEFRRYCEERERQSNRPA